MAQHTVTLIPGDGIGLETSAAMQQVVEAAGADIVWEVAEAGAACAEKTALPLPDETIEAVEAQQGCHQGPVHYSRWNRFPQRQRCASQNARPVCMPASGAVHARRWRPLR